MKSWTNISEHLRNKKFLRKSQMELMGIAIVVILLSLVLLFVVRFVILRPPAEITQEFSESETAANFLNTLLKTNAPDCSGVKFSTLFQDCTEDYPDGEILCNSRYSCEHIRQSLATLFTDTLEKWKINYYFTVYKDPDDPENTMLEDLTFGTECTGNRKVKIQPLPVPPETIYLALFICS